jgi:hypothetical protein
VSTLIKSLKDFSKPHQGEKIIVCGCGTSLLSFAKDSDKYVTIGVNDVPQLFTPTYLLVTDSPLRFNEKRRQILLKSQSKYLFTCATGWRHSRVVHFELGTKELSCLDKPNHLDHYLNSPYSAACLAYRLGAKNIGLIGVDFTNGHFYNSEDGPHNIVKSRYLVRVNAAYQKLRDEFERRGVRLYNLSPISQLTIPKITLPEFDKL